MKFTLVFALLGSIALDAQQDVIRTSTNEVVVDVVVRDKKGKLVRGLLAGNFIILEDGQAQRITSVREFSGTLTALAVPAPNTAGASASLPDVTRRVRLITLVFDRLGIDSRRLARQAAYDLIKEQIASNVYIAVFTSDLYLHAVQPFTNDRDKIKQAIENAVGSNAMTNYADANGSLRSALNSTNGSEGAAAKGASGPQGSGVDGAAMSQEAMNRMLTDMLEFAETSAQEQQGRSSIFGLWGIVKEQGRLPGRKTVLYFSEGLQLPNSLQDQFRNMISDANRANVSVYAIDARGLSITDDNATGKDLLNTSSSVSQRQYKNTDGAAVTRQEVTQFDRIVDSINSNVQVNLAHLAESTGGFLIANMNDFRQPIRRLTEENGSYYEVSYSPSNTSLDGSFRAIQTKLDRSDVKIQSRNGYFALPTLNGANVLPHEVPLLNALNTTPLPRGLDFRAAVLRSRPIEGHYQASIIFEMPMKDITFRSLDPEPSYRSRTSFLALVKDSQGQVIGKISRDLPINQPKEKLQGFQSGRVIFTRTLALAPGKYTIEAAASDLEGKKIAARKTSLIIPKPDPKVLAISTPVLVRRLDDTPAQPEANDPFIVGNKRVIPTLQDHVTAGEKTALSFFFTLYPRPGEAMPTVEIEFLIEDESLARIPIALPAPQADGSIPYIATIPLANFKPGLYEIKVRAKQAQQSAQQDFFITIE